MLTPISVRWRVYYTLYNISEKTLSAAHRKQVAQWALEKECCDVFWLKSVTVVDEIEEFVWKSEGLCHESGNTQARGRPLCRAARSAWSVVAGGRIFRRRCRRSVVPFDISIQQFLSMFFADLTVNSIRFLVWEQASQRILVSGSPVPG